jgi:Ser/Thr protein kinase RdoA (MazF antagonist)
MTDTTSDGTTRSRYWLATDEEVAHVAMSLGIPMDSNATQLDGNFSRLLLLDAGSERRVLKIRARWMTETRISFEHALAAHLSDRGLPMVLPIAVEKGRTWSRVEDLYCEVSRFVEGREVMQSLSDVHEMGRLLGSFHTFGNSLHPELCEPPHFQNQIEPLELENQLDVFLEERNRLAAVSIMYARWKENLHKFYTDRSGSLPQALRHGDFHLWNVLFALSEPSRIAALFDLDMAARGPRIYDISYALYMLRSLHPESSSDGWNGRYHRFIKGYRETNDVGFDEAEIAIVPFLIETIGLHFLLQKIWSGADETTGCDEYVSTAEWLSEWRSSLTAVFSAPRKGAGNDA